MRLDQVPTPALVVDLDVLERNITRMAQRAEALGVTLRPHLKTHKCVEIASMQRDAGAQGVTVSTLQEAHVFAEHGFDDITWAFPVIHSRIDDALELGRRIDLGLVVDSQEAIDALASRGQDSTPQKTWIKVDCGYHRAGVDPTSERLLGLAEAIKAAPSLRLGGILTHSGHSYYAYGDTPRREIAEQERGVMAAAAERLRAAGIDPLVVSVGSTPAMTAAESLEGVDEARPGNYAFFDYTQCVLGSCEPRDVAASVVTSVVSTMPEHSVVDAGALAMSKDPGPDRDTAGMGPIIDADGNIDEHLRLASVSQEHGIVNRPLPVGTRLRVMPNHSCVTVACFDEYHVVRGDEVVDQWKVWRVR